MIALLAVHATIGALAFVGGKRLGRHCFLAAAVAPAATLVWLLTRIGGVLDGRPVTESLSWVPQLGLQIDLRLDGFSALMVLLISALGVLVCLYGSRYFDHEEPDSAARIAGLLVLFAAAMLLLVLADNLLVLYVGWELTTISSYLLIGNDHTDPRARAAALQALLVTSMGGLVMLAGLVLLGQAAGTYRLSAILAAPPSGTAVTVAVLLILVGAFTKSAQYPFHAWLPGAMAAPTPVSAYLHSATMVKGGVYLVGRLAPAFATTPGWRPVVLGVGAATMVFGGLRALRQNDLKLLIAFGTVSQLGFLIVLFGIGTPAATTAGCEMLLAHAIFKAGEFMAVGTVDHHTGTRDRRRIPALPPGWRPFGALVVLNTASMAGIPLVLGFIGKEAALDALGHTSLTGGWLVLAAIVTGSTLTVAYSARLLWGMFAPPRRRSAPDVALDEPRRPDAMLVGPIAVLAAASLLFGVVPSLLNRLAGGAAEALDSRIHGVHLALWHGPTLALLLSTVAVVVGLAMFAGRRAVAGVQRVGGRIPDGGTVYAQILRGVNVGATRITGMVQHGSLPIYAGVILFTAAAVPGAVLLTRADWPGFPEIAASPAQVIIMASILSAAIAAAATRRRFSAALFLGVVGYSMAGLFVLRGAPDLALTQAAIETLSTTLFVLVLRRLPDRFVRASGIRRRVVRVVVSVAVGLAVFAFALVAAGARTERPVSDAMLEQSLPEGHGRNVVNVILVDIRGFDTLGELTVLASAGIGAVALARAGRGRRRRRREAEAAAAGGAA
ncbi:MAG: proton-conducting transporter membrane subunit [Ilumatobacteraceae bacterium]